MSGGGRSVRRLGPWGFEEERGGQAVVVVGCEPVSLCGRPCDLPVWAVSPNPYLSFLPPRLPVGRIRTKETGREVLWIGCSPRFLRGGGS